MRKLVAFIIALTVCLRASAGAGSTYQCAVDLCGSESGMLKYAAQGPFGDIVSEDTKVFFKTQADPVLEKIFSQSRSSWRQTTALMSRLAKDQQVVLDGRQTAVIVVASLSVKLGSHLVDVLSDDTTSTRLVIDAEKAVAAIPSWPRRIVVAAVSITNAFYANPQYADADFYAGTTFDSFHFLYGSTWSSILASLRWDSTSMTLLYGPNSLLLFDNGAFQKGLNGQDLNASEKVEFMKVAYVIELLRAANDDTVSSTAAASGLTAADLLQMEGFGSSAQIKAAMLGQQADLSKAHENVMNHCHQRINQAFAIASSDFRQRQMQNLLQQVKESAKNAAALITEGAYSWAMARDAIDHVQFVTPPGLADVRRGVVGWLQNIQSNAQARAHFVSDQEEPRFKLFALLMLALHHDEKSSLIEGDLNGQCDQLKPEFFDDFSSTGMIQVGWQSVLFPDDGVGVMAHELGHAVSRAIETVADEDWGYAHIRQCEAKQHQGLLGFSGDTNSYIEEDWADNFAVLTLRDLRTRWPYAVNFACSLMSLDDQQHYAQLRLTTANYDSHSTSFYRALQIQAGLGLKMPDSCRAALGADYSIVTHSCVTPGTF